jgi:hypothetical protein
MVPAGRSVERSAEQLHSGLFFVSKAIGTADGFFAFRW